jgi:WD40 repeat protein
MRYALPCLMLLVVVLPARAQDDPPDEGDPTARAIVTFNAGHHVGPINELVFTPDGKRFISAGEDRTVQMWDVHTGERLRVFRPPVCQTRGGAILAAALAPDSKTLACGGAGVTLDGGKTHENFLYLLNVDDGRLLPLKLPGGLADVHAVAFSPDGDRLAAGRGAVHVYRGLKDVWRQPPASVEPWRKLEVDGRWPRLLFSPDGRRLAVSTIKENTVRIWDLDGPPGAPAVECGDRLDRPLSLAWSPDGRQLLSGHEVPGPGRVALNVWSLSGERLDSLKPIGLEKAGLPTGGAEIEVERIFVRKDNKAVLLYRTADKHRAVGVFDPATGHGGPAVALPEDTLPGVSAGALSPDGRWAALAVGRDGNGLVRIDFHDKAAMRYLVGADATGADVGWARAGYGIAWVSASGTSAAGLDLRRLERIKVPAGELLQQKDRREDWALGPDPGNGPGRLKLSRGGEVVLRMAFGTHVSSSTLPEAGDVAWAAWTDEYGLHLRDMASGRPREFLPGGRPMRSVASSPDGKYLVAYSVRGLYHVYRPDRREPLLTVFASGADWVVWTEEGYYAATPGGERLIGWAVNNGPDRLATFYPAERFRKTLYRPDVVRLVLDRGNVPDALAAANDARKKAGEAVAAKVHDVGQLLPPRATLAILDKAGLPQVKVKATAEAAAKGQPVTALRLLVDGRPLPDGQGVQEWKRGQAKAEAEWTVTLPPGPHELKVLARSADTGDASAAVSVPAPAAAPAAAARPSLYIIAVGIDNYPQKDLQLGCAVADAKGLADAFTKGCAGKDNLFGPVLPTRLLNKDATRCAVLCALEEARAAVKPGDLLVFSFAGHGARQGRKFYLLTVDANPANLAGTALSGDDLRAALADMPCQVLLLLDACRAAAGVRAFSDEAARNLTDDETGVAVLCAAMGSEEAIEEKGHGLFSKAVITALEQADGVPFNRYDRRQYVHHLGAFVQDEVRERSHDEQHPFLTLPYVTESFPLRLVPAPAPGRSSPGER